MITIKAELRKFQQVDADATACFVFQDAQVMKRQIARLEEAAKGSTDSVKSSGFTGKLQESIMLYPQGLRTRRFIIVGLGESSKLTPEFLRRAAATATKSAQVFKSGSLALVEPDEDQMSTLLRGESPEWADGWESVALALAEGAALSSYKFDRYITQNKEKSPHLSRIILVTPSKLRLKKFHAASRRAQVLSEATCFARDLENAPGNEIFPASLAERARKAGRSSGFKVTVLDEKHIKALKMGGLLGVAQGSRKPPRFIIMEYYGARKIPTVVLVGKGVTFDSGGISIKPSANMAEMKMDMSGAAAVIATMQAVAKLKLPVNLIGLVPATENLPDGSAIKPGDIITHLNGKTSEVDNTDAEGRLILADALSYASRYKPDLVIDLATLTGAVVVALGHHATGMMGTDQKSMDRLKASGERTHERVWQLPLFDEYEKQIKSDVADVKNVGGRWGGAITAGMFLKQFIGNYRWVHLDIAGTAIMEESLDYIPRGGSGVGVRLLVDFLQRWDDR